MLVDAFVRKICVVGIPAIGMPDTQGAEQALCQFFQVIVFTCNIRDRSVGRYLNKRGQGARNPSACTAGEQTFRNAALRLAESIAQLFSPRRDAAGIKPLFYSPSQQREGDNAQTRHQACAVISS
ncbi:hypothetical protein UMZ34_04080 [Halopseudomonas pachastrellae]|nr:hypothetical protein UMZ34_04080 [Halopseudomonas pachastrellae]